MRKNLRGLALIMRLAFQADARRTAAFLMLSVMSALGDSLSAYWIKLVTDGALAGDFSRVVFGASAMGIFGLFVMIASWSGFNLQMVLMERVNNLVDRRLISLTAGIPGLEHHERPDYQDEISLLRSQRGQLGGSVGGLVHNLGTIIRVVTTGGLLASIHPLLLLLPLFGLPMIAVGAKAVGLYAKAQEETAEGIRRARHLFQLATTAGPGKELRIFGLGGELVGRHEKVWDEVDRVLLRASRHGALMYSAGWFVFAVGFIGAMAFVVVRAARGFASPGQVLMALNLAGRVNQLVQQAVFTFDWLMRTLKVAGRYLWLEDYARAAGQDAAERQMVPSRIDHGFDIEGVSFRYPGTEVDVLEGVDLHLPAGSTVAIVGENGAGKTTLVKLLSRFYQPTAGRISIDGTDLADFDVEEWREATSAGFQDFARFEFLAKEVVGIGDLPQMYDLEVVNAALVRANAQDVPGTLPNGLDTQLGKSFDDGVDLSIGQWQKLALGRAMMREAPLLLMLDEPTASLDAQTEHALFERYAGAARRVAETNGAITILVSHRFSTVRMADLIVVIDGGRVTEVGSHGDLIRNGSLYAELYELQARSYR